MSNIYLTAREIKSKLPHGSLTKIAKETGYGYTTVRAMENDEVVEAAMKIILEKEEKKKKIQRKLAKLK